MMAFKSTALLFILLFSINVFAKESGTHIELGAGYIASELENKENNNIFNYSGQYFSFYYNHLHKIKKDWHHYYGLNIQYTSMSNNADNSLITEKANHLSPGIHYKLYFKNIFFNIGYNYSIAEHIGSGFRTTNLDFDIHKLNARVGYDYPITKNLYLMGAYNYSYGLTTGLSDDHIYSEHIFSLNVIISFGSTKKLSRSSRGLKSRGIASDSKDSGKNKRNNLYDFFITTD